MTLASFKNNSPIKLLFALTVAFCWISQSAMDFFFYSLLVLILMKTHKGFWSNFKPLFKFLKFPLIMMIGYFFVAILGYVFNASPEAEALKNLRKFGWICFFSNMSLQFIHITIFFIIFFIRNFFFWRCNHSHFHHSHLVILPIRRFFLHVIFITTLFF